MKSETPEEQLVRQEMRMPQNNQTTTQPHSRDHSLEDKGHSLELVGRIIMVGTTRIMITSYVPGNYFTTTDIGSRNGLGKEVLVRWSEH